MRILGFFCNVGLHRWRGDVDSIAKRYRHNTWWDKTKNHLGSPRALMQTCKCCGRKRKWSFNRGKWRHYDEREEGSANTSAAWQVQPVSTTPEA